MKALCLALLGGTLLWAGCAVTAWKYGVAVHPVGVLRYDFPGASNGVPGHWWRD